MTTTATITAQHYVRMYAMAARLSAGHTTLAARLGRIRAEVAGK